MQAFGLSVLLVGLILAGCDSPEGDREMRQARVEASAFPRGAALYERQCRACHQSDGSGVGRTFPPLAGHAVELALAEGGREYLVQLTLHGLGGEIQVQGQTYRGIMPGFTRLSDEDIAAILNHSIHAWGGEDRLSDDFEPLRPEEVAAQREERLSPSQVRERRPDID
ncbi:c-type cytochrome [Natronospira bacteriovora]|uniref:Cytochrome c n=1 Tax=Natronospira bacteriovora TaxID=3069753 RepID=A0ABU0W7J1_9GAMM|nr:cytochrome c [Natronospira sp. AB-CW4]MDQ2069979.1 cytochrome c [Natronospira sp. AB-CW4]